MMEQNQWCGVAGVCWSSATSTSEWWVVANKYKQKCPA